MDRKTSDFKFEALLGSGSFGQVHLVRKSKDRKLFVIKGQDIGDEAKTTYEMVIGEVECLQKMRHPNIIAYHGAWHEGSRVYILMEYASRGTLKDLLERRNKPLKKEDAFYLFSQMVLGVHHIHSQNILHRDLKPENIMLTGKLGDIVKIGDFGVSKNIRGVSSGTSLAGSYYFMSPEMLHGKPCDFKADIWSMGAVLYLMITNELPFPAKNLKELMDAVCNSKIRPLEEPICFEVVNLVSKMLRQDPSYRPRIDQLLMCPYLISFVIRVHLNLGRVSISRNHQQAQNLKDSKIIDAFENYLKNYKLCESNGVS